MEPYSSDHLVFQLFKHKCHRLAMEVSRWRSHGGIHICMSINPDEAQVRTLLGMATHWSNSKAMKGQGESNYISNTCGKMIYTSLAHHLTYSTVGILWAPDPEIITCGRLQAWQGCAQHQWLCSLHQTASYLLHPQCEETSHPYRVHPFQEFGSWGHQSRGQSSLRNNKKPLNADTFCRVTFVVQFTETRQGFSVSCGGHLTADGQGEKPASCWFYTIWTVSIHHFKLKSLHNL